MTKIGIELGIRASQKAIERAAQIAKSHLVDYFFVPETHPKFSGVNAFAELLRISEDVKDIKLGTGIVNVFSRSKEEIRDLSNQLYTKTGGNFILGIGTSAPIIIEKLYEMEFKKPLTRLIDYTRFIKSDYVGPVYWAAVGEKATRLATQNADGVLFFLKPQDVISSHIDMINGELQSLGRSKDKFEVISIVPTSLEENQENARMTLAGYIGTNEFYSNPLIKSGFRDDVEKIIDAYSKFGLREAAKNVSMDLLNMAILGSIESCKEKIAEMQENTRLDGIILGFDLPEERYNSEFFDKLDKLLTELE